MTLSGYDAAYPPAHPPNDAVVMGYIGGNTPHVWSLAEWNSQPARYRIPIWTRSNPGNASASADATGAVAKLREIGAPRGCLVVLDYETAVDAIYLRAFDAYMMAAGHPVCVYGSASTLFHNPKPSGGYFAAQWTGSPHMYPGAVITQYGDVGAWDNDVLVPGLPLWDTKPAPPQPVQLEETDMLLCATQDNNGEIWMLSGGLYFHVYNPADLAAFASTGIKEIQISLAQHQLMLAAANAGQALTGALAVSGSLSVAPKG